MNDSRPWSLLCGALALLIAALVPSNSIRAAGEISQTRQVPAFDRIRLTGAFNAVVTAGMPTAQVIVRGQDDLVGRVTTEVHERTLVVGMKSGDYSSSRSPKLAIAVPELRSFANEGAASVHITGLTGRDFDLTNSGASSVTVAGRAARENITLDGAGKIDATGVDARDVSVDNNGVGSVLIRASGDVTLNVNGVGEIRYTGEPKHIESHVNGIGRIGRL